MMFLNSVLFTGVLVIDQLAKWWAIRHCAQYQTINSWLSCDVSYNRGFSWSMFHSNDTLIFCLVSLVIVSAIILFTYYTYVLYREKQPLHGSALVLAGAISNFIDRLVHGGVVDFIIIHYDDWVWPAFNIADMAICMGVAFLIFFNQTSERRIV